MKLRFKKGFFKLLKSPKAALAAAKKVIRKHPALLVAGPLAAVQLAIAKKLWKAAKKAAK
jgi:hypothetical protein